MRNRSFSMALVLCLIPTVAHADFLPSNDLWKEDRMLRGSTMTEETFNQVIDAAESTFQKIVTDHFGATLKVNRLWTNSTVNANSKQNKNVWTVDMYGGLARRPEVTPDGFTLVLCHEIGHHLGGYPYYGTSFFGPNRSWAAVEGQADYFATLDCSRQLWKDDIAKNAEFRTTVPAVPKALCDTTWSSIADQDLCYRQMTASRSVTDLNAIGDFKKSDFDTPSLAKVGKTDSDHPLSQCRLDTFVAGALCVRTFDDSVIPGKSLEAKKRNSQESERESGQYTCLQSDGFTEGYRPLCWFKSIAD